MSTRWMMVQYVGNTLRLPIVNKGNMDRPFGSSVLERDVQRIVVNPFSDNPRTFLRESENIKLRETCHVMTIGEFNGEATEYYDICSNCCYEFDDDPLNYCPNCGARIEVDA